VVLRLSVKRGVNCGSIFFPLPFSDTVGLFSNFVIPFFQFCTKHAKRAFFTLGKCDSCTIHKLHYEIGFYMTLGQGRVISGFPARSPIVCTGTVTYASSERFRFHSPAIHP